MLFLAVSVACAHNFSSDVLHLTSLPPDVGAPYFVMIHKDGCPHCESIIPTWSSAAKLGEGLATWADLNCTENGTACAMIGVDSIPLLYLFLKGQIYPYTGMKLGRLLVNWVANFANNTAEFVTNDNFTLPNSDKAAILFTEVSPVPKIWKAVENLLNQTDVKFFVSSDRELQKRLALADFPGVYAVKGSKASLFKGKLVAGETAKFLREEFDSNTDL